MRILDWRSPAEKTLVSLWQRGGADLRPPGTAAGFYGRLQARVMARRVAGRPAAGASALVVSIGNLALGGTGKTPVTMALAQDLAAQGHCGVVLTRGFRSSLAGPLAVEPDNGRAGDEARLLAGSLNGLGWRVVQSRDRQAGLRHALALEPAPSIVVLEDGHQTAGVARDLDVLIVDHWSVVATEAGRRVKAETGPVFPFGPWRESAAGATRAAVWLLETKEILPRLSLGDNSQVVTFSRELSWRPGNEAAFQGAAPDRAALVSGIARPAGFEAGASALLAAPAILAVRLADHEPYGNPLVRRICRALVDDGCDSLVTTAKDWVKLGSLWPAEIPAYVVDLKIVWGEGETLPELVGERLASQGREEESPL